MNITWRLAWRNLWRHWRRTWLTVGAMVFCNMLLIFLISVQLGSYQMMIDNSLGAFTGHLQLQHEGFDEEQRIRQSMPAVAERARQVQELLGAEAVAARGIAYALASSEERSFGIQVTGVEPEREPRVSTLPGLLREGRYLSGADGEIVVGALLARNLRVAPGDEITILGSGRDGSFAAAIATVVGIVDSGIPDLDRALAQVSLPWFQTVFSMGDHGHSVVVRLPNLEQVPLAVTTLQALRAEHPELVVLDWDQLQPGLRQAIRSDMASAWVMYGVLILLVAFSVLNTQLMSVLERTREFGVMLALGVSPGRLARLVGLETALLAALGLGLGVLLGALLALYLQQAGFTFPGMEEMNARFNLPERIYPPVTLASLLWGPLTVFLGALLAAVYPALRLFGLQPVAAMRAT
ncbi:FtsX-like permease family protein [Haliea sp. E1-2-M8]|uniref:ABC transporter permease n=1 Tax=Haliea sp. E1-2-M8 TaxID=3064706 RepID=UPI00271E2F23|nr:FtsX-like permease family protein [Haliea sp. E1-2-M8]MDO8861832.1 FtsX-like permease family protein [Haliea sp. E1-2-M8]